MVMLLHEPSMMHDLGFQLSFAAVIGIGMFGQYAHRFTSKSPATIGKWCHIIDWNDHWSNTGHLTDLCLGISVHSVDRSDLVICWSPRYWTLAVPLSMLGLDDEHLRVFNLSKLLFFLTADACVIINVATIGTIDDRTVDGCI